MIKITVHLSNEHDSDYEVITITKDELKQFACNKAKGLFMEGHWDNIQASDKIEVTTEI